MNEVLQTCSVKIEVPVAWGEMDAFQHVNNIVYFRYFESVRIRYLEEIGYLDYMEKTGLGPILASTNSRFRYPLNYPDRVTIATRVFNLAADRFRMNYYVFSHKAEQIAAEGQGVVVSYDYKNAQKISLPEEIRDQILKLERRFGNDPQYDEEG